MRRPISLGLLLAVMLSLAAAGPAAISNRLVFVSIPPQAWLVEHLVGDAVAVEVLLEPGASPATFMPSPKTVTRLADADIYFSIGVPFEAQLMHRFRSVLTNLHVVETQQGVPLRYMESHSHHGQSGGDEPDVHHGPADPHIWLAPKLMAMQTDMMADTLATRYPDLADTIYLRCDSLVAELHALDSTLAGILAPYKGRTMYVFHPAFGYFADAYGLKQEAIESEGKEPSIHQLINPARAGRTRKRPGAFCPGGVLCQPGRNDGRRDAHLGDGTRPARA